MNDNSEIIARFYTAFQHLDFESMNNCYVDDIVFSDPVFGFLRGDEVKAMWEMLCKNAKDFQLEFSNIQLLDEEYATCNWTARYIFSKTGRKVENKIKAFMRIQNGKITEHSDAFKLSKWASQAFGVTGSLIGWTGFFKKKVMKNARKNLTAFILQKRKAAGV